ncbi:adaptin N terminal region-domain-containing protein [Pisolithus albus]|nr:adaptin N terminal region-domain-containing protein [Pisolithus albus]
MWERTLQDIIRGLRANKNDEAKFIAQAMDEIRKEVKSKDMELKAGAIMKLTYLNMLGYDMNWASFHIIEVMSSSKIHLKIVGYLAAAQSFDEDTDVLMLTTNLIKKDLSSSPAEVAITLNGLSSVVTPDLARDLGPEVFIMLNHSRPHIRKRAVLTLYRVCEKYPEALPQGIIRLQERLDDPDPGVVSATVNVICELARRNPQDYLPLAPRLFHLLTTSSNNWMLIKLIKLFGSLSPHEPRLVKKLQPPITDLISTTTAISLLYECVHTCIIGNMLQGPSGLSLAQTCVSKLAAFLQDADQNLKYIALLALVKIVPTHVGLVAEHQDVILASVDDDDISIRMRALELVTALVSYPPRCHFDKDVNIVGRSTDTTCNPSFNNFCPISYSHKLQYLPPFNHYLSMLSPPIPSKAPSAPTHSPAYRLVLSQRIISMCSDSMYDNVTDFEWYLSVLVDLTYVSGVDIGAQIRDQLVDVVGRVRAVRPYAVKLMVKLLSDETLLVHAGEPGSCSEVLWAAAWICGEYCSELLAPEELLPYLLHSEVTNLDPDTVAVYLQAATKVFGYWCTEAAQQWTNDLLDKVKGAVDSVMERLEDFVSSPHIEVQERAANILQLFAFVKHDLTTYRPKLESTLSDGYSTTSLSVFDTPEMDSAPAFPKSLYLIHPLFSAYELNPVASAAQASVAVPEGLDLDAWIVPSMQAPVHEENESEVVVEKKVKKKSKKGKEKESSNGTRSKGTKKKKEDEEVLVPLEESETARGDSGARTIEPRLFALKSSSARPSSLRFVVEKDGEMPEGAMPATPQSHSAPISRQQTPSLFERISTPPPILPSFQQYDVPESDVRASTPEPIKVTKAKRKGASTGKKKRTTGAG